MKTNNKHSDYDLYDDVEKIKADLITTAYDIKGKAGEVVYDSLENAKDKTDYLLTSISDYTAEKPFKTISAALLLGGIIGYFMKR